MTATAAHKDLEQPTATADKVVREIENVATLPGSIRRPAGKETHYGTTDEADPYDVEADWNERS